MAGRKIQHTFINGIEGKICSKCNEWKPLTEFYARAALSDGLRSDCKECSKAQRKSYYQENKTKELEYRKEYVAAHKEEVAAYNREYNKEHSEEKRAYNEQYRKDHHDEMLAYSRRYNEEHKEERRKYAEEHKEERAAYKKEWRKNNPEKVRAEVLNRIAMKKNAEGRITSDIILEVCEKTNYCCAYCGKDLSDGSGHIDHIVPLSKGGSNTLDNLTLACQHCNCSKGAKDVEIWCQEKGIPNPFAKESSDLE